MIPRASMFACIAWVWQASMLMCVVADEPVGLVVTQAKSPVAVDDALTTDNPNAKPKVTRSGSSARSLDANSATLDEAQLLGFVEQHQPALLKLLKFMSRKQPTQYAQALKELSRTTLRLNNLEKKDKELYDVELALWKTRSELRMLVAELAVTNEESEQSRFEQLRLLVRTEFDLERSKLNLEQLRAQQRLDQINGQLKVMSTDEDAQFVKALNAWESRITKQPRAKPKSQP
jgi:hypothetical protein